MIHSESNIESILNVNNEQAASAVSATKNLFSTANSSIKTPISLLQEICMKCHIQPNYEVLSTEGQIHDPTFVFKVTVGDISAIGKGTSKKRAKHTAALTILNEIKTRSIGKNDQLATQIESLIQMVTTSDNISMNSDIDTKQSNSLSSTLNDQNQNYQHPYQQQQQEQQELQHQSIDSSNPVGDLLELTQKYSIRPPVFEFGAEEGPPHNRQFVCYATLNGCKEVGLGRAKKDAKRQAALKLLAKIKSNSLNLSNNGINTNNFLNNNDHMKDDFINTSTSSNLFPNKDKRNNRNINNSFSLFKQSDKPLIKDLLSINNITNDETSENNCKYLDDLAKELNFEINYNQIPVLSKSGQYQVLLQLKINPLTVIHGTGLTLDDAKRHAAYNALSYIKLICAR